LEELELDHETQTEALKHRIDASGRGTRMHFRQRRQTEKNYGPVKWFVSIKLSVY
jgi:hypothetical protein